jgi:hypothetical protein
VAHTFPLAAVLVTIGVPVFTTGFGVVMGALLNATLTARAAKRELDQADQHDLLERIRYLELQDARRDGRDDTTERNQP